MASATHESLTAGWLAAIVESSDDAIVSETLEGIIMSWNPAAETLFGYTADEVIGRPISILAAPGCENEVPCILERIRRGERVEPDAFAAAAAIGAAAGRPCCGQRVHDLERPGAPGGLAEHETDMLLTSAKRNDRQLMT